MKNYKEIEFYFGDIYKAVEELQKHHRNGELVFIDFNGQKLYSDEDDIDSAYLKVTGKTKKEFDEIQVIEREKRLQEERVYKESIPELAEEWIAKGELILESKYHKLWAKCVPIRLGDLYKGMELGYTLELVDKLNKGVDYQDVFNDLVSQGHSGMSFGLMKSMLKSFCDKGEEFVKQYCN